MAPEWLCCSSVVFKARFGRCRSLDPNQENAGAPYSLYASGPRTAQVLSGERTLNDQIHPMGPHHMPFYLAPGSGTDVLMVVMGIFLIATLIWVGTLYLRLHSLPERMAHKSEKLQFEIVAILGLLALFTHIHLFWVAGLLLAMIDIPDFGTPLRSIAGSVEKIASAAPEGGTEVEPPARPAPTDGRDIPPSAEKSGLAKEREHSHV